MRPKRRARLLIIRRRSPLIIITPPHAPCLLLLLLSLGLLMPMGAEGAAVEAVFELSWTSTLQTGLPIATSTTANQSSSNQTASREETLLDRLTTTLSASGAQSFTETINDALRDANLASALVVNGASAQSSQTSAVAAQSCVVINRGVLRNFVNASTGLCQPCTVCAGAYVSEPCWANSDASCVAACAVGQRVYTAGIQPPELGGCAPCHAGQQGPDGVHCAACPAGTVAPQTGMSACTACAVGTVAVDAVECLSVRPLGLASLIKSTRRRFPSGSACVCAARGQAHAITI